MRRRKLHLSLRALLAMMVVLALCFWAARPYVSPYHRWLRAVRHDQDGIARWQAASEAIQGRMPGIGRDRAIGALRASLADPSPRVRATAAGALGLAGPDAVEAIPALVAVIDDENTMVRWGAVESLGMIAGGSDVAHRDLAVAALIQALEDRDRTIRKSAAFWLAVMGEREAALPVLTALSEDGEDEGKLIAIALGLCGARDDAAVESLQLVAKQSYYESVRRAASEALARLRDDESGMPPATPSPESDQSTQESVCDDARPEGP